LRDAVAHRARAEYGYGFDRIDAHPDHLTPLHLLA